MKPYDYAENDEANESVICPSCGAVYRRKVASQQSRTNSNQNNSKKTTAPAYDKAGFDTTASKVIKKTSSSPNDNIEKNQNETAQISAKPIGEDSDRCTRFRDLYIYSIPTSNKYVFPSLFH